jgi:uncharacterized protein YndB with AHSA1/START domain
MSEFKPKTVYVTYIASTPEKVWQGLTDPAFTTKFFFGCAIEIEPKVGGSFILRMPDGRANVKGEVVEWSPPRRLSTTWTVEWMPQMRELPACLVTYDIERAGDSVRLTMTEAYQWDVPEAMLMGGRMGGRMGWPAILSGLKSLLETGKPLSIKMAPPKEMMEAVKQVIASKSWRK